MCLAKCICCEKFKYYMILNWSALLQSRLTAILLAMCLQIGVIALFKIQRILVKGVKYNQNLITLGNSKMNFK